MNLIYWRKKEAILKNNANRTKTINREILYFNSLMKLKYSPDCRNIDKKDNPNEILSTQ